MCMMPRVHNTYRGPLQILRALDETYTSERISKLMLWPKNNYKVDSK